MRTDARPGTLTPRQKRFLSDTFPGEDHLFSPEETLVFGADGSRLFAPPLAVVRPRSVEQVQVLMRWAVEERMPLYPRGRGTNMVGDCVPDPPGVVVSTLKLDRILEVSPDDFVAVVEPGVITAEFQAEVERQGLFYPPDPASVKASTLGGNVITCAGGMRALKYGVTRDFVLGLEAVLPGGELLNTGGRTHKNVVGLDLTRLIVGSEGALAFVTKIILKLLPKPESSASVLAGYASLEDLLDGARAVFRSGSLPAAMEFMGEEVLDALALAREVPWPGEARTALLLKLDGSGESVAAEAEQLRSVLAASGPVHLALGVGPDEEEPLWELRRRISPASFLVRPDKLADDITVPRGALGRALTGIREISRRLDVPILTFGHFGDGNIHVNIMHDARDTEEARRARDAKAAVTDLVLELNGSLSGEHGVGLIKAPYVHRQLTGLERHLMRRIKEQFDPLGILNPGKGF